MVINGAAEPIELIKALSINASHNNKAALNLGWLLLLAIPFIPFIPRPINRLGRRLGEANIIKEKAAYTLGNIEVFNNLMARNGYVNSDNCCKKQSQ